MSPVLRIATAFLFAALMPVGRAAAQDAPPLVGRTVVAAGSNLSSGSGTSPSLLFGREWRAPRTGLGLRLTAEYNGATRSGLLFDPSSPTMGEQYTWRAHDIGFGAAATYTFSTPVVQPYLLSGLFIQNRTSSVRREPLPSGLSSYTFNAAQANRDVFGSRNRLDFGGQLGVGLATRIRGASLFSEVRILMPIADGERNLATPFTIGLRF